MTRRLLLPTIATLLVVASAAQARAEGSRSVAFLPGIVGSAGVVWLDRPDTAELVLPDSGDQLTVPAFRGLALGAGLAFEARFFELVGVELEAAYSRDAASGDAQRALAPISISFSQPALHVPILLKAIWARPPLSPFAEAGLKIVVPGLSRIEAEPSERLRAVASAGTSAWLVVGLGAEWRPAAGAPDWRVPVRLRAALNPAVSGELDERAVALPSDAVVFDSTLRYELALCAGLSVAL